MRKGIAAGRITSYNVCYTKLLRATTASFIFEGESQALRHQVLSLFEHEIQFQHTIKAGDDFRFAWCGAACSTENFADPQNESERFVIYVMRGNKQIRHSGFAGFAVFARFASISVQLPHLWHVSYNFV